MYRMLFKALFTVEQIIPTPYTLLHYMALKAQVCCGCCIWAQQQLVAIPGWLLEDQNARLDQEGQFASIKEPRYLTIKKNKAKEELFTTRRGGTRWRPKPSPTHPPVATFAPGPAKNQNNPRIC
jgi:hypothetical protein